VPPVPLEHVPLAIEVLSLGVEAVVGNHGDLAVVRLEQAGDFLRVGSCGADVVFRSTLASG
jgi:hypothetical protein